MWRNSRQLANSEIDTSETKSEYDKYDKNDFPIESAKENSFEKLCGFRLGDVLSFEKFTALLYRPADPASLGVVRALFGKSFFASQI